MKTTDLMSLYLDLELLRSVFSLLIMLAGSVHVIAQQLEIEWDGNEVDVLRFIEGSILGLFSSQAIVNRKIIYVKETVEWRRLAY